MNLRGTSELALDVLDQPGKIEEAIGVLYKAWWEAFRRIHDIAAQKGVGLVNWVALWSNQPYHVTECDFCYMLGPKEFEALFLPDVARQAGTAAIRRVSRAKNRSGLYSSLFFQIAHMLMMKALKVLQ